MTDGEGGKAARAGMEQRDAEPAGGTVAEGMARERDGQTYTQRWRMNGEGEEGAGDEVCGRIDGDGRVDGLAQDGRAVAHEAAGFFPFSLQLSGPRSPQPHAV